MIGDMVKFRVPGLHPVPGRPHGVVTGVVLDRREVGDGALSRPVTLTVRVDGFDYEIDEQSVIQGG